MNYLIPVSNLNIDKGYVNKMREFNKEDVENIITQQVVISQLANGISYADTENMDEYERVFVIKKLIAMKKEEIEAKKKAMSEMKK